MAETVVGGLGFGLVIHAAGVSAVRGLGERLVAGEAAPDEWTVRSGVAVCTRQPEGAIEAPQAKRIAELTHDVAETMGAPQDIDWAWVGDELYLLQSRPIAASEPGAFFRHWRFGEWLGDPITPLFETWLLERMESALAAEIQRVGGVRVAPPYHVVVNGWDFYSMNFVPSSLGRLLRALIPWVPKLLTQPRKALRLTPTAWPLWWESGIKDWEEVVRPQHREAVRLAADRVDRAGHDELIELIDGLAVDAGSYFYSVMTVAGTAAKAELPLAILYPK